MITRMENLHCKTVILFLSLFFASVMIPPMSLYAQIEEQPSFQSKAMGISIAPTPPNWIITNELPNSVIFAYKSSQAQFGTIGFSVATYLSNFSQQKFVNTNEITTTKQFLNFSQELLGDSPYFRYFYNNFANYLKLIDHTKGEINTRSSHVFDFVVNNPYGTQAMEMVAFALYGGALYVFVYYSPSDQYDGLLPQVKQIINSTEMHGTSKQTIASNLATFYSLFMGVSMQVPANWGYMYADHTPVKYAIFAPSGMPQTNSTDAIVQLYTIPNIGAAPFEKLPELFKDYATRMLSRLPDQGHFYPLPATETTIHDYKWWQIQYGFNDPSGGYTDGRALTTTKDNIIYLFNYMARQDMLDKYSSDAQGIINSFTFVESQIK